VESMCRALAVALCHEIDSIASIACEILRELVRLVRSVEGPEHVVFTKLIEELDFQCRTCKWRGQNGAISAFDIIIEHLSLPWVLSEQLKICNSLIYVVKGQLPEVMNRVSENVKSSLVKLLNRCYENASPLESSEMDVDEEDENNDDDDDEEEEETKKKGRKSSKRKKVTKKKVTKKKKTQKRRKVVVPKKIDSIVTTRVVEMLATELSSRHSKVRDMARDSLEVMAKLLCHGNVSSLLSPHCEELRSYIFSRQFRVHPIDVQIGQIEALAYGLSLSPPIFTDQEKLLKLLKNALKLTDTHDPEKVDSGNAKARSKTSSSSSNSSTPSASNTPTGSPRSSSSKSSSSNRRKSS